MINTHLQIDAYDGPTVLDDTYPSLLAVAVDDEEDILDAVTELMKDFKIDVVGESDPRKAVELVKKLLPDVIVLDIMMPGMDGYEFAEEMGADPRTSHIPIVYLTAKCIEDDLCRTFTQGGIMYVKKPFMADELAQSLRMAVSLAKTL
jgi:CheY-like chemotaxis protein